MTDSGEPRLSSGAWTLHFHAAVQRGTKSVELDARAARRKVALLPASLADELDAPLIFRGTGGGERVGDGGSSRVVSIDDGACATVDGKGVSVR
jgi:hypothetical protein